MKKVVLVLMLLAAIGAGGFWLLRSSDQTSQPATESPSENQADNQQTKDTVADEATVTYDGENFSPASLKVSPGTKVKFVNQSSGPMWVASDPHPVHTDFSQFDANRGYTQGQTYSFTFSEEGSYGYHNHLIPASTGTVVVQ